MGLSDRFGLKNGSNLEGNMLKMGGIALKILFPSSNLGGIALKKTSKMP